MRITGVIVGKRLFLVLIAVIYFTVFLSASVYANNPPNATIQNTTGYENTNITFNVSATDSDDDPVTYSSDDPNVVWNGTDLYYVTDYDTVIHPDLTKTIAVNITADDGLLTYTQEVNVTILDVNRAPYWIRIVPNSYCNASDNSFNTVAEDMHTGWTDCLDMDTLAFDPDGDELSYSFFGFWASSVISPLELFSEQVCQFDIDEDNRIKYSILENYTGGCNTFIDITDSYGLKHSNSTNFPWLIRSILNQTDDIPPDLNLSDQTFYEGEFADLGVYAKDFDGESMTYTTNDTRFVWDGTKLSMDTDHDIIQHPNQSINLTVNITGTDGKASKSQLVDITLIDVNRAPYWVRIVPNSYCNASDNSFNTVAEDMHTGWTDCLDMDTLAFDPDGDELSYSFFGFWASSVISPLELFSEQVCQFDIDENNRIKFRVVENYVGGCNTFIDITDSYGLKHSNATNLPWLIRSILNQTNDAPILTETLPTITLNEDEYNDTWTPIGYFADYESNPIFFSILNGINILADNITWNFTAGTPNWFGEENLTLTATDNMNDTTINLTVKVLPVNDAPIIDAISDLSGNESEIISITPTATDVDSVTLTFNANNSNLVWNTTTDAFEWIPDYYDYGNHTINMTVSDSSLDDYAIFNIEVLRKRYGFSIELIQGWNFISIPYALDNTTVASMMSDISSDYIIWAYNSSTYSWQDYDSTKLPSLNNLTDIQVGQGLWINISDNETLSITGTRPPETGIALNKGWNMISYPLDTKRNINDTLSAIDGKYDIVWQYNASSIDNWTFYNSLPEASPANTLHVFTPGYSYWINMTEATDLTFSY